MSQDSMAWPTRRRLFRRAGSRRRHGALMLIMGVLAISLLLGALVVIKFGAGQRWF